MIHDNKKCCNVVRCEIKCEISYMPFESMHKFVTKKLKDAV